MIARARQQTISSSFIDFVHVFVLFYDCFRVVLLYCSMLELAPSSATFCCSHCSTCITTFGLLVYTRIGIYLHSKTSLVMNGHCCCWRRAAAKCRCSLAAGRTQQQQHTVTLLEAVAQQGRASDRHITVCRCDTLPICISTDSMHCAKLLWARCVHTVRTS